MKTKRPAMMRQGDVLLIATDKEPDGKPLPRDNGRVVLAYGEATGHSHAIPSSACSLYAIEPDKLSESDAATMIARLGGGLIPDRLLEVKEPVELQHEEHSAISIPAGRYICRIQGEYSPRELRNVGD